MKFGKVENPDWVDFTLPEDHPDTQKILSKHKKEKDFEAFVGCAKWNRQDLKGFYPRGTKDELTYYSTQFNSIDLIATYYKMLEWHLVYSCKNKYPAVHNISPK